MAYIFLRNKTGQYKPLFSKSNCASINASQDPYECRIFDVVKHKIQYPHLEFTSQSSNPEIYNLYIYSGHNTNPGELKYTYYPTGENGFVQQVDLYYVLNDDLPLAVVFTTFDYKIKYCKYDELNQLTPRELQGIQIEEDNLYDQLLLDYEGSHKCKTLHFKSGSDECKNVVEKELRIGPRDIYKRVAFTPKPGPDGGSGSVLFSEKLFTEVAKRDQANKIDYSYLTSVHDQSFNAVIVYYIGTDYDIENLAILIEFINCSQRTSIKRTDRRNPSWTEDVNKDNELLIQLNMIKDEIDSAISYNLEKNRNDVTYDSRRITVRNENTGFGYNIYIHKPDIKYVKKQVQLSYNGTPVCPQTNNEIQGPDVLKISEVETANEISTYTLSDNDKEHLLIRLTKEDGTKYYLYRYSKDGIQWRQVGLDCIMHPGINVSHLVGQNLSQRLEKVLTGDSVKKLLDCIKLQINSIFVLLNKKERYDHSQISDLIKTEKPPIHIDDNSIDSKDVTDESGTCINSNGYRVYKHDLTQAARSSTKKLYSGDLYLRFYFNSYKIELHDNEVETIIPKHLIYSNSHNDLYVYFYGYDHRPLLLCYNGNAYIPKNLSNYTSYWVREGNIKNCLCQDNDKHLLNQLSGVVGFLNTVDLKQTPLTEGKQVIEEPATKTNPYSYSAQVVDSGNIVIKLTHENKKCYRIYTHEPYGSDGLGVGYRLGKIKYLDKILEYNLTKQLIKVGVYYNVYDQGHEYPLLAVLEFKGNSGTDVEYHKFKHKDEKEWVKMEERSDKDLLDKLKENDKIEDGLYQLRKKLQIEFENKEKIKPLFKTDLCKEDSLDIAAIAGGTVGAAAVIGTGATVGVIVSKNLAAGAAAAAATTVAL